MVHCAIILLAGRFFCSPNTLETSRNEAVYLIISSTDIFKTNRKLLSIRCVDKIPRRMSGMGSNSARDITMTRTFRMVGLWHDLKIDISLSPMKDITNLYLESTCLAWMFCFHIRRCRKVTFCLPVNWARGCTRKHPRAVKGKVLS